MSRAGVLLLSALVATPALAVVVGGVNLKESASVAGQTLVLNGAGVRTKLVVDVYVASLYLPAKATSLAGVVAQHPRRIQLNMMRTLSAAAFVEAFDEGLENNNSPEELAATKAGRDQMAKIMNGFGEAKEGDVVTLDFVDGVTTIGLNGTARGTIPGEAFNVALTKIWLGAKPVQGELKKRLLGGS